MEDLLALVDALPDGEPAAEEAPDEETPSEASLVTAPVISSGAGVLEWEVCGGCGVPTEESATESMCPQCGQVYQRITADEQPSYESGDALSSRPAPALRVSGGDAGRLDKFSVVDQRESAYSDVLSELQVYDHEFSAQGGAASISGAVLREVARIYVDNIRERSVVRAQYKQAILAKLIEAVSSRHGCPRIAVTFASLMHLKTKGLARGEMRMREMNACEDLLDEEQCTSWMRDALVNAGLFFDEFRPPCRDLDKGGRRSRLHGADELKIVDMLLLAAQRLVELGNSKRISVNLKERTRAIGSVHVVLRRAAIAGILPSHWGFPTSTTLSGSQTGSIEWMAQVCGIRAQTIKYYTAVLYDYHFGVFEKLYKEHALWSEPCTHL